MIRNPSWTVDRLILHGEWKLSISSLSAEWNLILKTDIHAQGTSSDFWMWIANAKGDFTFQSAWNLIRQVGIFFEFQQLVWSPANCPKMAICLLRSLNRKLLTKERLLKFGIIQENVCYLCNAAPETNAHLYFECSYSSCI